MWQGVSTISEYPTLTKGDDSKLLMIKSADTLYLGAVITTHDVDSVLLHKVFVDNTCLLEDILDMHTSLQVHPFVPRTFTLQMMKTPFVNTSGVGMFIGEAPGDWNLGCANGMEMMTINASYTMAYHVLKCLLRVQIISIRVLGFTMKRIQPARIWKWRDGLRVDFIGCLADTLSEWHQGDPVWGGQEGLGAIRMTLEQLDLFNNLPSQVIEMLPALSTIVKRTGNDQPLNHIQVPTDPIGEDLLHKVYNICKFTTHPTSVNSDWEMILGSDKYEKISLNTVGATLRPYGPFYIHIHHQCFKWNKAIIVEPRRDNPEPVEVYMYPGNSHPVPRQVPCRPSKKKARAANTTSVPSEVNPSISISGILDEGVVDWRATPEVSGHSMYFNI